ncbi:MAG: sensor histidine kinase [Cellvibrionaceae bacterium]
MLRTLKNRLTLILVLITMSVGAASLWVGQVGMRLYYEELTQELNQNIAMYVTQEHKLLETKLGTKATIEQLSHQAMIINPIAEVYLLNPDGSINSHALEPDSIRRTQVELSPIHEFLAGNSTFPLRGNDPRHLDTDKIFSVSEIRSNEELQGYLYVILGGQLYDNAQKSIEGSYIRQQSAAAIAVIVIASLLIGVILFRRLTMPLAALSTKMNNFSGFNHDDNATPDSHSDITRLDAVYEAMRKKIEQQLYQLQESDRLRRELISNVSHDLRTPLATIQGYIETLFIKNDQLTAVERAEHLETAAKGCSRLSRLIADLFELSKLESGNKLPDFEQFSIAELIHDTAQEFSLELEKKDLTLAIGTPTENTIVFADIGLIQRVLENLIRNAIAHTPEHGEIRLNFTETPESVQVTVEDNGSGITSADIPFIFERFYQSADKPQEHAQSSGLGLAIVKRILDLHGCRIEVHSTAETGTRFEFDLPVTTVSRRENPESLAS